MFSPTSNGNSNNNEKFVVINDTVPKWYFLIFTDLETSSEDTLNFVAGDNYKLLNRKEMKNKIVVLNPAGIDVSKKEVLLGYSDWPKFEIFEF